MMASSRVTTHAGNRRAATVHCPRLANAQAGTSSLYHPPSTEGNTVRRVMILGTWLVTALGAAALLLAFVWDALAIDPSDDQADVRAVVSRYYTQINQAIRTGDLSLLDHVTEPMTDDGDGTAGPACDLRCRVGALHRLAPSGQLTIVDMLVEGDQVAVSLQLDRFDAARFLGLPLTGELTPWPAVDLLRITDGRVSIASPSDTVPVNVEPLARMNTPLEAEVPHVVGLIRLTLDPAAALPDLTAEGPVVLAVERGTVSVHVDRPVLVYEPARAGRVEQEAPAVGDILLASGEFVSLAPDTHYALRGVDHAPATILGVAVLAEEGHLGDRWVRLRPLDAIVFMPKAPHVEPQTNPPPVWPDGITSTLLGAAIIHESLEGTALSLARITLPSHGAFPVHVAPEGEVFAVETGSAAVDLLSGQGEMRSRSGPSLAMSRPGGGSAARSPAITTGGSGALRRGAVASIRSLGDEPLVLLVLSLETGSDGS